MIYGQILALSPYIGTLFCKYADLLSYIQSIEACSEYSRFLVKHRQIPIDNKEISILATSDARSGDSLFLNNERLEPLFRSPYEVQGRIILGCVSDQSWGDKRWPPVTCHEAGPKRQKRKPRRHSHHVLPVWDKGASCHLRMPSPYSVMGTFRLTTVGGGSGAIGDYLNSIPLQSSRSFP